ncbi:hypothetical protein [Actinoplanes sp. NPDC020271]|uniref:hypothetical protein n=1 Tax=Actinoplanes sp. NPDC020271 TaxID=3363896 RepID=UPI0037A35831
MAPAHLHQPAASATVPRPRVAYLQPGNDPEQWLGDRPNMYETDWTPRRRHRRRRSGRGRSVVLVMTALAAAVGGVYAVGRTDRPATAPLAVDAAFATARPEPTTPTAPTPTARPRARVSSAPAPRAKTSSPAPRPPRPVSGLNQAQMNNAAVIVRVARDRGLPRRAMLVAMMTGLQESDLRNLANPTVPASLDRPHEGSGDNFDSLGVFQQRPSQGWGSVAELMDLRYASGAFYERLLRVDDWESKALGDAAQAVQRSAVPGAYADHEDRAAAIVDALL